MKKIWIVVLLLWSSSLEAQTLWLAAASTREAVEASVKVFEKKTGHQVSLSFAASSTLARQISMGAPAHLFLSANQAWMDLLEKEGRLVLGSNRPYLSNQLVLVAPKGLLLPKGQPLVSYLNQTPRWLAMGDPAHVPAGVYAKAYLEKSGLWDQVKPRMVPASNVRMALALVERGECSLGLVYLTDALASKKVQVLAKIPKDQAPKIVYSLALVGSANEQTRKLYHYLTGPKGRQAFWKFGFLPL